ELRLRSPQLQGSMPPDLSRLRQLEALVIEGGRMDGGIPSLGSLTQLRAVAFVGSFVGLFYLDSLPPGI
ncbi:FLS2, partial [Symbiodinium sp. CCMP2456]